MPGSLRRVFRFGPFELDIERADLRKHGVRLRIQDQPLCILKALLENPGVTVSREELVNRVWPSGIFVNFEHSLNAAVNRLRQVLSDSAQHPRYIETVARHGYCFTGQVALQAPATCPAAPQTRSSALNTLRQTAPSSAFALHSLAVLPFANLSPEHGEDYFSDGLAEEIINCLTKIQGLRVIARASSSLFRDRRVPLKEVVEHLNVAAVLDGSFRRSGNRIRITAQLVRGADESCLWSDRYDRRVNDILDIQEDIARSIVSTLRLTVGEAPLTRRYTRNDDAHLFYLKGVFHLREWGPDSMERLAEYMKRVVALEPAYAPAWVELAHLAVGQVMTNCVPATKVMPEGIAAACRAVAADPDLAEAHSILGLLNGLYEFDWAGGLSEFQLAVGLNPTTPSVHYYHAMILTGLGRVEEAISELRLSLEVDPFSVLANSHLSRLHTICGDYTQAIAYGNQAVEVGPHHWPGLGRLGEAYVYDGELEKGITLLEQSRSIAPSDGWYTAALADAYCRAGQRAQAEEILSEVERRSHSQYVPSAVLAFTASALGQLDRAFEYFDRSLQDRDGILFLVPTERSLEPIRKDVRYAELLRLMNLPIAFVKDNSDTSADPK